LWLAKIKTIKARLIDTEKILLSRRGIHTVNTLLIFVESATEVETSVLSLSLLSIDDKGWIADSENSANVGGNPPCLLFDREHADLV